MIPINSPNLPESAVKLVLAGSDKRFNKALEDLSIRVLNVSQNKYLEPAVSGHTDILVYHLGKKDILLSQEQMFLQDELANLEFNVRFFKNYIMSPYPKDVPLNAARVGDFLICNPKTTAIEIKDYVQDNHLNVIAVNQGYTKCTICIINDHTIITEDQGIKTACEKRGLEVLLIRKGPVRLHNKEYGFFGGCTGLIDKNKLAITGNIETHTDCKKILEFLNKHGVKPIALDKGCLTDIGGIIPLMQENSSAVWGR